MHLPTVFASAVALALCGANFCSANDGSKADRDKLLAQRVGFGAKTTGGYDGPTVHVTTDADSGPGSLREAVVGNQARWIVFDGDYTIHLSKGILVGANKTIDGRGRKVTLTGHNTYGLILNSGALGKERLPVRGAVENVIVENLILHDFGDTAKTKDNDPCDAINIGASKGSPLADRIWIDHCDLSTAGDKLIGIDGATNVTVSNTHFHDQEQTFQIGNMTDQEEDAHTTVTITRNYFDHTGYRNPVVSYGKMHEFNNYISGWKTYGMRSERVAQAYLENNVFEAGENKRATVIKPGGKGTNDAGTRSDDRPGYLKAVGNLQLNGAKMLTNEPEKVFDPSASYTYKAEPASEELAKKLAAEAGWQPAAYFGLK